MTFDQIIKHYKTQAAVARELDLDPVAIHHWKIRGVPKLRQLQLQLLTNGALKADKSVKVKSKAVH